MKQDHLSDEEIAAIHQKLNDIRISYFHDIYETFRAKPHQIEGMLIRMGEAPGTRSPAELESARRALIMLKLKKAEAKIEGLIFPEGLIQGDN